MCSATTWLPTAVLRLSKRPAKPFGQTKTELLPSNSAADTAPTGTLRLWRSSTARVPIGRRESLTNRHNI